MKILRRLTKREAGLTLLELTVVSAIMSLMAGLVALAVAGRTSQSRESAQTVDVAQAQKAVDAYTGENPTGRYPTLNGCLAGKVLDLVTKNCVLQSQATNLSQVNTSNLEFTIRENATGGDLNGDGDAEDTFTVVPIIWEKAFKSTTTKRFVPDFLARHPKHAYDFLPGGGDSSWKDSANTDPDGLGDVSGNPSSITAPLGLGSGVNRIDSVSGQVPAWVLAVIDGTVRVLNLLPEGSY